MEVALLLFDFREKLLLLLVLQCELPFLGCGILGQREVLLVGIVPPGVKRLDLHLVLLVLELEVGEVGDVLVAEGDVLAGVAGVQLPQPVHEARALPRIFLPRVLLLVRNDRGEISIVHRGTHLHLRNVFGVGGLAVLLFSADESLFLLRTSLQLDVQLVQIPQLVIRLRLLLPLGLFELPDDLFHALVIFLLILELVGVYFVGEVFDLVERVLTFC